MNPALRFFSHPAIGILGSVASIIGFGLSFYFYYASIRSPELTYHLHPVRTTIVKTGGASALQVSYAGNEIQNDITAVQIALWNAGKEPVTASSVLTPIQIQTEGFSPILEATIRKVSRPESQITLDQSQIANGSVGLKWGILEQGDGAVIQLIYLGGAANKLTMTGSVIGQKRLSELTYSGTISSPDEQYAKQARDGRFLGLLTIGTGMAATCLGGYGVSRLRDNDNPPGFRPTRFRRLWLMLVIVGIVYAVGGCIALYYFIPPTPPFGF